MKRGTKQILIWVGLALILFNFIIWILTKGSDASHGIEEYYTELILWLIVLNIPAMIILLIGIFSKKDKKEEIKISPAPTNKQSS